MAPEVYGRLDLSGRAVDALDGRRSSRRDERVRLFDVKGQNGAPKFPKTGGQGYAAVPDGPGDLGDATAVLGAIGAVVEGEVSDLGRQAGRLEELSGCELALAARAAIYNLKHYPSRKPYQ